MSGHSVGLRAPPPEPPATLCHQLSAQQTLSMIQCRPGCHTSVDGGPCLLPSPSLSLIPCLSSMLLMRDLKQHEDKGTNM